MFLRVVEVFPPTIGLHGKMNIDREVERFLDGVKGIRDLADVILVANLKSPVRVQVSPLETATMLQELLRVEAAPVVVLRDANRRHFMSTVITAVALDLRSIMIAWGDDLPRTSPSSNIRDFRDLAEALGLASSLRKKAGGTLKIYAPLDVDSLGGLRGALIAKKRIRAGADLLLSQPPTTDPGPTLERHMRLLKGARLADKALLNVFPFKDARDVKRCERYFGWKLPKELHSAAEGGRASLDDLAKSVIRRLEDEGAPGVYLSTRGNPAVARALLT